MARKNYPVIGERRYRVDWCSKLEFDDAGDVDRDNCTESYKTFPGTEEGHAAARKFAEETWPLTHKTFGVVEVTLIEFVAYDENDPEMSWAGSWQDQSDAEIFSGEWES